MFTKEELVIIHKSICEMDIKGSDAPQLSSLLSKIAGLHEKQVAKDVKTSGK